MEPHGDPGCQGEETRAVGVVLLERLLQVPLVRPPEALGVEQKHVEVRNR